MVTIMRITLKPTLLISLFALLPLLAYADPTISSVTGTVGQGNTLTINGTLLLNENNTNWLAEFRTGTKYGFEGASYLADDYFVAPEHDYGTRSYDATVKLMGEKSYKGRIVAGQRATGLTSNDDYLPSGTRSLYVRFYSRWHSAGTTTKWPDAYIKLLDTEGTSDQLYLQPCGGSCGADGQGQGALPTHMTMQDGNGSTSYAVTNFLQDNRWYCIEAYFNSTASPVFTAWVDGVQIGTRTPGAGSANDDLEYIAFNMINLDDPSVAGTDFDLSNWTDNFTLSTSRVYPSCLVEIGDSPTYASATKVTQALTSISDTSVSFTADLTGLGDGPYYLWITDNRQVSSDPYTLGATNLLTEHFDDSSLSSRGWVDDTSDIWIDTSTTQSGAGAMRVQFDEGATNCRNSTGTETLIGIRYDITDTDQLYMEYYWRFNSDWVGSGEAGYHPHLMFALDSLWTGLADGTLRLYAEPSRVGGLVARMIIGRGGSTAWYNDLYTFSANTWYKIGVYAKMNTVGQSDGQLDLFVNDVSVYSTDSALFRTSSETLFGAVAIAPWLGDGSPQAQTMWIDELEVWDGMPDEESPSTPTITNGTISNGGIR